MTDKIELTIPSGSDLEGIATLVIGGIGSRLELSYERTDDLQLAVLSALAASVGEVVTVEVEAGEEVVGVTVGPLADGSATDPGLRRVVDRLVDEAELSKRHDGEWLELRVWRSRAPSEQPALPE